MKGYLLMVLFLITIPLSAQEEKKMFDVRFGIGTSLLGSGDMRTLTIENELNYKISRYFGGSLSMDFGRSNAGVYETASFIQGNLNLFVSPFKNSGLNDFRIGAGLSIMNVSDAYLQSADYVNGQLVDADYQFDLRNSLGYSIIIEDTYSITDKFLVGLKVFTQPYSNGDINSGILLKFGFMF